MLRPSQLLHKCWTEAVPVLKSLRCKYETVPLGALGYFRCRLYPRSTEMYTHIEACSPVHIQPSGCFIIGKGDQKQKENGPCLVQPSYHTLLIPDWDAFSNKGFPSPAKIPLHISITCYWIFFHLALRRYNKSWVYRTRGEGIVCILIPSYCNSIIHLLFEHYCTKTAV